MGTSGTCHGKAGWFGLGPHLLHLSPWLSWLDGDWAAAGG